MAKPSLIAASNAQNGEICSLLLEHFAERRFQLIRFSNQEFKVELKESVRGEHVYILQNIDQNPSEALMELVQLIHCCKLASAAKGIATVCSNWCMISLCDCSTHCRCQ